MEKKKVYHYGDPVTGITFSGYDDGSMDYNYVPATVYMKMHPTSNGINIISKHDQIRFFQKLGLRIVQLFHCVDASFEGRWKKTIPEALTHYQNQMDLILK